MQKVKLACARAIKHITELKAIKPSTLFFAFLVVFASVNIYISIYAEHAQALPNDTINFQARLLSNTGSLVPDGFYTVEFKIYNQQSGGTESWSEVQAMTAKNGYLTASLGSVNAFGSSIDWSQKQWLSMNVNGDGEMNPRMQITAVPLAFRAVQADSLTTSGGTVSADDIAQIAPGAVQSTNSANSLLRLNQTGSGGLLQLQNAGVDILTLSNSGDLAVARGITLGTSTNTTAGTLRWTGSDFEGYDGITWKSLTQGGGSSGGLVNQQTVVKTTDEILNNSAVLQDDNELSFSIRANETWVFRFVLQANSGTTPDLRFAVTAPGGANCRVGYADNEGATSNGQYGCGVSTASVPGNGATDVYEVLGTVTNGATAGNVTLRWAQFTATTANTTVYAGSYVIASTPDGGGSLDFTQNGNSFGQTAVLGTNDGYGLNLETNGIARLIINSEGNVDLLNNLSVGDGLSVTGNSTIDGTLSGLTGLTVNSGGLLISAGGANITGNSTIDGVLNLNNNGITNAGDIIGVGNNITANGGLNISSGGANNLNLSSGSGTLVLDATTLLANNSGTTTLDLSDSADTTLRLLNSDGTAGANLSVEGQITAQSFNGDGASITSLDAGNISSGTINDSRLSSNVALLNTSQTFSALQTLSSGLVLGNTANTMAGTLRWTGADFEGYNGTDWVSLTGGSSVGPLSTLIIQAYDSTGGTDLNTTTPVAVPWDAETKKDTGFTHDNVTNNTRVILDNPGWYKVSYNVSGINQSTNRNTVFCQLRLNGSTYNNPSGSYSYTRDTANAEATNTASVYLETTLTNEYYEVMCSQAGTSGQHLAEAGRSWTIAEVVEAPISGGGPTSAFEQGGNDFGATALLGTTASNDLILVTSGTARLTIDALGEVSINNNFDVSGSLTADLDTLLNGNVTLGDSAGDVLSINSSAVTISNGLLFDSGTFTINSADNQIGINNATPGNTLAINTPAINDSTAEVLIYTGNASQKALVLQANNGQTANFLEAQDNNGNSLFAVNSSGALILGNDTASPTAGQLVLNDSTASNGFTGVLGISTLTNNRTINLPDASGTICLEGSSTCGFITLAPSGSQADSTINNSIFINKTGASGNLVLLQKNGTDVFNVGNDGATTLRLNSATAFSVLNGSGVPILTVDTTSGVVRIGNNTADGTGNLLVLDTKNTAGDPTGENGGTYYNSNSNKFRCYENNSWRDCIYEPYIRSFIDGTSDPAVDANTTNYWDLSVENSNSYPNMTLTNTTKSIMGVVTIETTATTNNDTEITARIERGIGTVPTCGSGTAVGSQPGTFSSNTGALKASTVQFLDSPNTTQPVYYVVCSDTATVGTGANVTRIRVTLQEVRNQN